MHGDYRFRSLGQSQIALAQFVLLASVLASPGFATPLYEIDIEVAVESGGAVNNSTPGVSVSGSNTVSLSDLRNLPGATAFASGAAGPGSLAVIGSGIYSVTDPNNQTSAQADATVISTTDDVVFPGTGTLDGIFLNMDLSGSMSVFGSGINLSSLSLSFKLNGQPSSGINGFRTVQLPFFFSDDGILDGVWSQGLSSFSGTLQVGPFDNVPTNVPVSARMAMTISAGAFIFPPSLIGNAGRADADLGSTLSFTSSGPVFSDSGGLVSVNSVEGSIVNGLWTGSPVSAPPIPEPSAISLLSLGCLGLTYARRQKDWKSAVL